ncbi:MAG: hypothetical protein EPN91_03280 [Salinibacterium sp.]|nr:MAG: hypothetical protein EPN91_03280 [Salinibacterium sp.]
MSTAQDASAIAALEAQRVYLDLILVRTEQLRRELAPNTPVSWFGHAERMFKLSVECLAATVEGVLGDLRSARMHTSAAISTMSHHV